MADNLCCMHGASNLLNLKGFQISLTKVGGTLDFGSANLLVPLDLLQFPKIG